MSGITLLSKKRRSQAGTLMLLLLGALPLMAQTTNSENVGIGTTKPDKSALLDLNSTSKGLLVPRMTLSQRGNIQNPANGLMIYQTDFLAGFYFFNGSTWKSLSVNGATESFRVGNANDEGSWSVNGNGGLKSELHFIGTTDTSSLAFKVNNIRSGLIDYRFGNTYFGYRAGYRSSGFNSVAIGAYALHEANSGLNNIAIGYQSLPNNRTGSDNVAVGANALFYNVTGSQNIAIGTQAGQKSIGDGNVFIGNNAGVNEIGNNKLYIENGHSSTPLLYGDFTKEYIGINTKQPENTLSIDSKIANNSGLQLKQLTNASPAGRPTQKVLSVDDKGHVILVRDSIGIGGGFPVNVPPNYWTLKGASIENNNAGEVLVGNLRFKNLRSTSAAGKSNLKVLSVDENGLLVLVKDSVGITTTNIIPGNQTSAVNGFWDLTDNTVSNTNTSGKVVLKGGVRLQNLTAFDKAYNPYGKVLTVDDSGNLLLVRDSVGTGGSAASPWSLNGAAMSNTNGGLVTITSGLLSKNGIKIEAGDILFPEIKATSNASRSIGKVLSVDNNGKLILVRDSVGTGSGGPAPVSSWTVNGTAISNNNGGIVTINNGLTAKNGIKVESGSLLFTQLKSTSPAARSNGKVLSVDESGNVVLVKDSVGIPTTAGGVPILPATEPSAWNINDNNISNKNTGSVFIGNGLVLSKLSSESPTTVTTQKVLSVDATGKVILVSTPTTTSGGTGGTESAFWKNTDEGTGITNKNAGMVLLNSNVDGKSGLQFSKLKSSTTPGNSYGKVLSVDDNGNVILVNDAVGGATTSSEWNVLDGRLHNANGGKVVIGTGINSFPDGFSLFVKGGILTERVRVALANSDRWADYVFKKDYKLMPLKDVEKFINHNQHLPNVPSAEEMAKTGLDLAETSAKLMEKIEELTLYLIEANKKIEALESKVNNLEKIQK